VSEINIDKTAPDITSVPIGVQNPDGTYSTNVTVTFDGTDTLSGFAPEGAKSVTGFASGITDGPGSGLTVPSGSLCDLAGNCSSMIAGPYTVIFPAPPTAAFGLLGDQFRFKIPPKDFTQTYLISATQGPINFVANQVFFYHPLTEVGSYEVPALDAEMYNFIDGNITYSNPAVLPLQLDERKKELPLLK
jgi:hypothetical protein